MSNQPFSSSHIPSPSSNLFTHYEPISLSSSSTPFPRETSYIPTASFNPSHSPYLVHDHSSSPLSSSSSTSGGELTESMNSKVDYEIQVEKKIQMDSPNQEFESNHNSILDRKADNPDLEEEYMFPNDIFHKGKLHSMISPRSIQTDAELRGVTKKMLLHPGRHQSENSYRAMVLSQSLFPFSIPTSINTHAHSLFSLNSHKVFFYPPLPFRSVLIL